MKWWMGTSTEDFNFSKTNTATLLDMEPTEND